MIEDKQNAHKETAINCFNATWDLIEKNNRTKDEDREMIHTAHASLYHWLQVGTPLEFARGEWIVSRVYSILGMGHSALYHGEASLQICLDNGIEGFDISFGYEAMARAYKVLGENKKMEEYVDMALKSAEKIKNDDDKKYTLSEINNIK